MHLMCNVDASGKRVYTLQKVLEGKVTKSAHPARFSPDDKWSKHRNLLRKRFGRLPGAKSTFCCEETLKRTQPPPLPPPKLNSPNPYVYRSPSLMEWNGMDGLGWAGLIWLTRKQHS